MSESLSQYRTLILILILTTAAFVAWMILLFFLWLFLRVLGITADFWALTEALSTAVTAAAVLGAGFVAYRELTELDRSRYLEVGDRLFEELNSVENVEARRWIFQNLTEDPQEGVHILTPEGRAAVKTVLNSLDRVAFLSQSGWIPEEMIMPWMNSMVVKAWARLEPYVLYESQRRQEPDYYVHAQELAERCRAWRVEHHPEAEILWLEDAL